MTIERKNPYGPLKPARLAAFEASLQPYTLPDDFRAFLLEHNGAVFADEQLPVLEPGTDQRLCEIYGLHGGPDHLRLDDLRKGFSTMLPPHWLGFAADPYGNYFAMSLDGADRGAIYFLDHEALDPPPSDLPVLATSFEDLVRRAGGLDVAPPRTYESVEEAIEEGDIDAVRSLLAGEASGRGLVHAATSRADAAILRLVLAAGGDPDERGAINGSETPLFVAARTGRLDLVRVLLEHGADPDLKCSEGGTALEMAAPFDEVHALLAKGRPTWAQRMLWRARHALRGD